jgi:hypothetical protein
MKIRLAALLCLAALPVHADGLGAICPDRPGKGTSPCTVDTGHAQVELGLFDESTQRRSGVTIDTGNAGSVLAKYGISDGFDLEAGMALFQFQRVTGTATKQGIGDLLLRAKYAGSDGALTFGLDPYVKLPTATGGLSNNHVEGGLVAPLGYDVGGGWSLSATPEADLLLNGFGSGYHGQLVGVAGLGKSLGAITLGVEVWSSQNLDPAGTVSQYSADLDAAWAVNNDTQLDAGANLGLNRATPDLEVYIGVSRRF